MNSLQYKMFDNNIENDTGRGQCLYVPTNLGATQVYFKNSFEEAVFVSIDLKGSDKLMVGLVYRSGSGDEENNRNLNELTTTVCNSGYSHILLMGDYNYKDIDWELFHSDDKTELMFVDCVIENGLVQHVDKPTRNRGTNQPSLLDLVLTNEADHIINMEHNSSLGKSDYCTLEFDFQCYWENVRPSKEIKLYRKADYQKMKNEINGTEWIEEMKNKSIENKWDFFTEKMRELVDNNVPTVKVKQKIYSVPLDPDVRTLIKEKDTMSRKLIELKRQKKMGEYDHLWKKYCKVRNKVRKMSRLARKEFENSIANESKEKPKRVFSYMNSRTKVKPGIGKISIDLKDPNSQVTDENNLKAKF